MLNRFSGFAGICLGLLAWMVVGLAVPAHASPMVDAYKQYQAALGKGDLLAADASGEKAWQLAEAAKNDKYIAILAYNLAELRAEYEPGKDALTPAKRAAELVGATDGALPSEKTTLLVAVLEWRKAPTGQNIKQVDAALTAFTKAGIPSDFASFEAYGLLQAHDLGKQRWEKALANGQQAISAYQAAQLKHADTLAEIYLSNGIALVKMAQWEAKNRQLYSGQAMQYFDLVVKQLAPIDYQNIPHTYLVEEAWQALADIMRERPADNDPMPEFRKNAISRPDKCEDFDFNRKPPRYPARAAERGLSGGVSVVYDLDENGRTTNIRIGAATTGKAFDRKVRNWVKTMRANNVKGQDIPVSCRTNQVTTVGFALSN